MAGGKGDPLLKKGVSLPPEPPIPLPKTFNLVGGAVRRRGGFPYSPASPGGAPGKFFLFHPGAARPYGLKRGAFQTENALEK